MPEDLSTLIDRLGATALECRALLREMHEMQQSLAKDIKGARQVMVELRETVTEQASKEVRDVLDAQATLHLGNMRQEIDDSINLKAKQINAAFDVMVKPYMASLELLRVEVTEWQRHIEAGRS